ncbi:hypothetical protein [Sorangium sp. So ce861]|uniref:hypothetical protein n=1 Tax=Sorangium sp. So ce861 TaxID=3133323 RepID=UPI003F6245D4
MFADAGVRYLVIGGHAVSLHARPRTTKDLDLWLDAAPENIGRACAALLRFGVPDEIVANLRTARPDIGRDDLLASKRAVGRPQDLRDVRAIERAAGMEPQKRPRARRKP